MSDRPPQDPRSSAPGEGEQSAAAASSAEDAAARAERAAAEAARQRDESFALAESAREAARKAGRFSREFVVTVISVVTTAFGVVVALAWNTALTNLLSHFSQGAEAVALFLYALLITFCAVIAIIVLSRVARRIGADPVEFKIEASKLQSNK